MILPFLNQFIHLLRVQLQTLRTIVVIRCLSSETLLHRYLQNKRSLCSANKLLGQVKHAHQRKEDHSGSYIKDIDLHVMNHIP